MKIADGSFARGTRRRILSIDEKRTRFCSSWNVGRYSGVRRVSKRKQTQQSIASLTHRVDWSSDRWFLNEYFYHRSFDRPSNWLSNKNQSKLTSLKNFVWWKIYPATFARIADRTNSYFDWNTCQRADQTENRFHVFILNSSTSNYSLSWQLNWLEMRRS